MTVLKHELNRNKVSFLIWAGAITFLLCVSVFLFPEMRGEMEEVGKMFSEMGSFTAAFGMDKLDFGTLTGYYATECGNVLGLGGAFFASLSAVSALSKEENYKTAEFLFSHPISRARVVGEKLLAVILSVTALNVCVYAASVLSVIAIGESVPWTEVNLLHLSYYIMQIEIACVCFCISAFAGKGSAGIGLGVAAIMYFLNILQPVFLDGKW